MKVRVPRLSSIVESMEKLSTNLPEWITALTAASAGLIAFYEFYLRRRPYMKIEVDYKKRGQNEIVFLGKIVNFGKVPAFFSLRATDIKIKIGDEEYIAESNAEGYAYPNETQPPIIELGFVNEVGISRLINHEYKDNTASLEIELSYRSYRWKWVKYKLHNKYGISFSRNKEGHISLTVSIIKQDFN